MTGNDEKEKQVLKKCLIKEFEINDLEILKYFAGFLKTLGKGCNVCYVISQQVREGLKLLSRLYSRDCHSRRSKKHQINTETKLI